MIIKNLDYLFQNVFIEGKPSQKHYNNTRYNKINQMVALRMAWYSLISIHKSVSRAMISECLMTLDHLSRESGL